MRRGGASWAGLALHGALLLLAAASLVPLLWMLCAAFKRGPDLVDYFMLPWDAPERLSLENFSRLLNETAVARWLLNSLFLASTHAALVVLLSSLGGFALAKYRFRGRRPLMLLMLGMMLLPGQVLLPGTYELIRRLGWLDSYPAVLLPGAVSVFGLLLFRQTMAAVPDELLHSARVDGCSELRLWWAIVLPLVRPMTAAFALMSFLASWNSLLWPQIILQSASRQTLPIGLSNLLSMESQRSEYGILMAGTLVGIVPVMLLFFAMQREFVAGLTAGALRDG